MNTTAGIKSSKASRRAVSQKHLSRPRHRAPQGDQRAQLTACDSLLSGDKCGANTVPYIRSQEFLPPSSSTTATTSKISRGRAVLLRQRGLAGRSGGLVVNGFVKTSASNCPWSSRRGAEADLVSLEGSVENSRHPEEAAQRPSRRMASGLRQSSFEARRLSRRAPQMTQEKERMPLLEVKTCRFVSRSVRFSTAVAHREQGRVCTRSWGPTAPAKSTLSM